MGQMGQAVQSNATTAEEAAASAEELSAQAQALEAMVRALAGLVYGQNGREIHPAIQALDSRVTRLPSHDPFPSFRDSIPEAG
jgi:hypothetical protein